VSTETDIGRVTLPLAQATLGLVSGTGPHRMAPAALHVGYEAWDELRKLAMTPVAHTDVLNQTYFGVPVSVNPESALVPLGPREWRLVNRDGEIIKAGVLAG